MEENGVIDHRMPWITGIHNELMIFRANKPAVKHFLHQVIVWIYSNVASRLF